MSDDNYLKCPCQKCSEQIEFSPGQSGELIDCPHCSGQTILISTAEKIPVKPGGKLPIIIGSVLFVLILATAGVILYRSRISKQADVQPITPTKAITNAAILDAFTEIKEFGISPIILKKSDDGGLVYAVGTVKNNTSRQRFGVKIELDLLNKQDEKFGSASDYIAELEPQGEWQFKALLTDLKAVKARLSNIEEQK